MYGTETSGVGFGSGTARTTAGYSGKIGGMPAVTVPSYYSAPGWRFSLVERVPPTRRPVENFRRDTLRGGGLLSFSAKLPRVGLSGLNRAKPSHIRHSHIILRRISTSFVGSNRRRQQDSRKGCRLPASRRVFGVFGQSRGEPHNFPAYPPILPTKNRRPGYFRADG